MNDSAPLRVAQAGVGGYGGVRRHLLRQSGLFNIIAVHDWNSSHQALAAREESAQACDTYEELLAVDGLEAVVISTGAKFHAGQILAALHAGLPVFVEKPLCSTREEMQTLLAAQEKYRLPVGLGHDDHESDAVSRTIKNLIERGELGTIVAFEQTVAHSGGFLINPGDWRGDAEKNPGGMLFQCGVHAFHELMFYFGPIAEVSAVMRYDLHTTATADVALCQIFFESGLIGSLSAYHVTPYRHFLAIYGTRSSVYRDDRAYHAGVNLLRQNLDENRGFEPQVEQPLESAHDACGNLRAFYRAVRAGVPQYPSLLDGARAVASVFAAEESARSGQRVPVTL